MMQVGRLTYDVHFREDIKMRVLYVLISDYCNTYGWNLYVLYIICTPSYQYCWL